MFYPYTVAKNKKKYNLFVLGNMFITNLLIE